MCKAGESGQESTSTELEESPGRLGLALQRLQNSPRSFHEVHRQPSEQMLPREYWIHSGFHRSTESFWLHTSAEPNQWTSGPTIP